MLISAFLDCPSPLRPPETPAVNTEQFGIRSPLSVGIRGFERCSSLEESVSQSIRLILTTRPGTLPLTKEFGCRIHELVFRPLTTALKRQAAFFVEQSIAQWEPRALVNGVEVLELRDGTNSLGQPWGMAVRVNWQLAASATGEPSVHHTVLHLSDSKLVVV
ncbi:MAG TPA: hypothetical protein DDW52_28100 [Planctomycetaceae bacterium]|nr:hypothetical protein [Planctomycetaceae bacterium]